MAETGLEDRIRGFLAAALRKTGTGNYGSALEDLRAAEVLDRENPEILYNLGICYARTGFFKSAADYFRRILGQPLTFVDVNTVRKLLAYCVILSGGYEEALSILAESIALSPGDSTALNMKGYCLEKTGRHDEAIEVFREIIAGEPDNWNAHNSLAYLLAGQGFDSTEAATLASRALKAKPLNPAYLDTMGYVCMKRGQARAARDFFKKALALMPDSAEIKSHISELLNTRPGKGV
ncbi:MAG TPA: tetratricopeptide repeat protein [Spirochaetota bacterium]|jgi:Flp pilus assembly protein TadD|nr:tetratricopeptide repeat protein [Spirochaetota bacterium]HPO44363.1 tetratricopeptide repeat protein [Spirochaetota bacterium]